MQKTILITGCSSGIGYHAAVGLKKRGHRVIASCRKESDLERLSKAGLEAVLLDVTKPDAIESAFQSVMNLTGGSLDVLINNAGYGQAGALEDIPADALREQFETNVFGLMALIKLVIPVMRRQGKGRIINISSILGLISLPFRGAYNASKYAVEGLSDTLRLELKSSGIRVITVQPGPIDSEFRNSVIDRSLQKIDIESSAFSIQYKAMLGDFREKKTNSPFTKGPSAVLDKLIHAIEAKRPKSRYPVTFPAHLFVFLKRILPAAAMDWVLWRISKKELS